MTQQAVSARFLLEGAAYALEQAGLLLHDAYLLYKNERYGSAIVLALFSREEIGRYRLIRDLRRTMIETGDVVTVDDINRACDDHVKKQRLGHIGSVIKVSEGEQIWDLLKTRMYNHLDSVEYKEADKRLDFIVKRMNKEIPHQRHELRQKALYVEPADSAGLWNQPKNNTKGEAHEELEGASNAYSMALDRFTRGDAYYDEDPSFYDDLGAWNDCPVMPNPLGSRLSP